MYIKSHRKKAMGEKLELYFSKLHAGLKKLFWLTFENRKYQ